MSIIILTGDCRDTLATLPEKSAQCCVTSPPYFGLRDYNVVGQIGLEPTPDEYVREMVAVFGAVRRVLKDDGVLWLNLGDSYSGSGKGAWNASDERKVAVKEVYRPVSDAQRQSAVTRGAGEDRNFGLKSKDLIMIPTRVAMALQQDGWYLRAACPWIKRNGMPDSTQDRPTQCVETVFMLTKSKKCYYDSEAVKVAAKGAGRVRNDRFGGNKHDGETTMHSDGSQFTGATKRLRRTSDWFFESWQGLLLDSDDEPSAFVVNLKGYKEAHFATFPPKLVEPCVLATSRPGDTVIDPFGGSGTTAEVARQHGRSAILCELNPDYVALMHKRLGITAPVEPLNLDE